MDLNHPPSPTNCGVAQVDANGFNVDAATMADLCAGFSVLLDRHVIDKTGIAGRFNINLDLTAEDRELLNRPRSLPALSDPTAPANPPEPSPIVSALIIAVKKLGLKLAPAKGPGEFLVIDHVERPSGN